MGVRTILIALATLAGCSSLPRDPDGTSDRVRGEGVVRVGHTRDASTAEARALLQRLERATGARVRARAGETEPLLLALEHGELDLVLARFDAMTPWATRVALGPPLAVDGSDKQRRELRAAVPNGENRWLMLVESESRAVAPDGGR